MREASGRRRRRARRVRAKDAGWCWARANPAPFAVLLLGGVVLVHVSLRLVRRGQLRDLEGLEAQYLTSVPLAAATVFVLVFLGWPRDVGLTATPNRRALAYLLLPAAFPLVRAAGIHELSSILWIGSVCLAMLVSFHEEVVFRGLLMGALAPGGAKRAVLLSAVAFGAAHLLSQLYGATLAQSLFFLGWATCMGVVFGALRLCTRSLWPPMLLHALFNLLGDTTSGTRFDLGLLPGGIPIDLVVAGPLLAAYGWLCMLRQPASPPTGRLEVGEDQNQRERAARG